MTFVRLKEADEELQSDDEDFGNQAPSAITMQRCRLADWKTYPSWN